MRNKKYFISLFAAIVLIASAYGLAQALPYAPGQTLDPSCNPGDANCTVQGAILYNGTVAGVNATSSTVTFNIQGSGALNPFNVASSSGSSLLTVLANGNVGIGTTSPAEALSVVPSGINAIGLYGSNGTETAQIETTGANGQAIFNFPDVAGAGGNGGANLFVLRFNGAANKLYFGDNGTSSYISSFHPIGFIMSGSPAQFNNPNPFVLFGYTGVGIGTTTINQRLVIQGTDTFSNNAALNVTDSNGKSLLFVRDDGTTGIGTSAPATTLSVVSGNSTVDPFNVSTSTSGSLFHVSAGGNVGIGTSTPVANFQVANGANATTTAEFGSAGQNKGTCIKLYRSDGSAIYASVAAGATAFTLSTTPCATVTGF